MINSLLLIPVFFHFFPNFFEAGCQEVTGTVDCDPLPWLLDQRLCQREGMNTEHGPAFQVELPTRVARSAAELASLVKAIVYAVPGDLRPRPRSICRHGFPGRSLLVDGAKELIPPRGDGPTATGGGIASPEVFYGDVSWAAQGD